jgi:DNA end-binding protein Ku
MRAFWSGDIELGIIPIPVKMYTATKDLTPQFHQLHDACGTRISLVRRCDHCKRDLAWEEIVKGHEVAPGEYVPFTKEELAELQEFDGKGVIKILHTVKLTGVDPLYLDSPYYLAPGSKRVQMYNLLREELARTGLVAIGTVALRTRPKMCMIAPHADLLALTTMHYAAEIIDAKEIVPPAVVLREQDREQTRLLLSSMEDEFHPENHSDEYLKKLMGAVQEKVEDGQTVEGGPPSEGTKPKGGDEVLDLGELLARSIKQQAARKKGGAKAANDEKAEKPKVEDPPKPKAKGKKEREGHTPSRRAS